MSVCQNSLTDIKVLLDFLKQNDSTPDCEQAQITSLQALSSMCTKQVSELIMQCGGLNLIWKLCGTTKCPEVCQSCLYTLACASESNVHVKLAFSTKGVFSSVKSILKSTDIPDRTRLFAIYFLIPLVTESESGQDLMKSSGCLNTLLEVFISGVQLITCEKFSKKNCKREIWLLSAKALRRSVALPRNETNQLSCIDYIPHTITILHESKGDEEIVLHTCQLFSAVLECNKRCQEKSLSCRALEVLVLSLQSSSTDEKPDKLSGEIVICLNNLLEDQRSYYERFGKLGGIAILLRILDSYNEHLTSHHLSHILMILGRCASHSESCQQQLVKNDAASTIVRLMNNVQTDEYFNKIAASVLNYCMQESKAKVSDEGESDESEDDKKDEDDSSSARSSEDEENADPDLNKHQSSPSEKRTELNKDNFDEMFNGGGSCITDIIERQQTQIDLLQALLLQERDKRIENEKTWTTIANSNAAMSTRGSSILSPDEPGFRSHHLPLRSSNVRRCPSKSWSVASASNTRHQKVDKRHNEEQKIKSFSDRRTFLVDLKNKDSSINNQKILTSTSLATPDNPNPPTPHFISPDLNVEKRNLDSTPESNSNKSSRQSMCISSKSGAKVKRHKMNGSQNGSIIDVESFTPKKSEETMMKYYVKEKDKITQRVSKTHTFPTHKRSKSESYLREEPTNCLNKVSNEEDDLISVCSEIIQEEINKERKHCPARRCSSANMNPKVLRSMGSSQKVTSSEEDVYSYKKSPKAMTFKKPMAPPPRFTHTTRRPRRKFDYQERRNLDEGVRKLGPNFKEILYTYEFHPTRTAMDLRDKYRNMMKL